MFSGHGSGEAHYQGFLEKADAISKPNREKKDVSIRPLMWLFGCQSIALKQMAPNL